MDLNNLLIDNSNDQISFDFDILPSPMVFDLEDLEERSPTFDSSINSPMVVDLEDLVAISPVFDSSINSPIVYDLPLQETSLFIGGTSPQITTTQITATQITATQITATQITAPQITTQITTPQITTPQITTFHKYKSIEEKFPELFTWINWEEVYSIKDFREGLLYKNSLMAVMSLINTIHQIVLNLICILLFGVTLIFTFFDIHGKKPSNSVSLASYRCPFCPKILSMFVKAAFHHCHTCGVLIDLTCLQCNASEFRQSNFVGRYIFGFSIRSNATAPYRVKTPRLCGTCLKAKLARVPGQILEKNNMLND